MQPDIIALGEPLYELNSLEEGDLRIAQSFQVGFGGDTSNFAVAAARSGAKTGYLTRLGQDSFGDALTDLWNREGIDSSYVVRDGHAKTGIYFISRGVGGHFFTYYRANSAASRMQPGFFPPNYIANAKLLHVSGISQAISPSACATVAEAITVARSSGTLVTYDTNLRLSLWPLEQARETIHSTAPLCDIFLPSLDDVTQLTGLQEPEEIIAYYQQLGVRTIVLKLGSKGALLAHEGRMELCPAYPAKQVDASGAGDCFCGSLAAKFIAGNSLHDSVRYACAAAALSVGGLGAVPSFPRQAEVLKAFPEMKGLQE